MIEVNRARGNFTAFALLAKLRAHLVHVNTPVVYLSSAQVQALDPPEDENPVVTVALLKSFAQAAHGGGGFCTSCVGQR